jgi:hypothetical protein
MFYGNEILYVCMYVCMYVCVCVLKNDFVLMFAVTSVLVDHEFGCIEKPPIFLAFHTYEEDPNRRLYASCALI